MSINNAVIEVVLGGTVVINKEGGSSTKITQELTDETNAVISNAGLSKIFADINLPKTILVDQNYGG